MVLRDLEHHRSEYRMRTVDFLLNSQLVEAKGKKKSSVYHMSSQKP
jgi:hypothetical protein